MDDVRARIRALPQRRVTVLAAGRDGSIFVDGRPSGTAPMTIFLPAGRYRIGGAAGTLRVPSFEVDVTDEDRTVVLDFETAEALRIASGPGLALPPARRGEGLIRAGAWLDVDKLVVAARAIEGDAPFLVGAIYDVRRGALLREGSVRTVAGSVPSVNIGALAAFLLTGAQQREVRGRSSEVAVVSSAAAVTRATPPLASSGPQSAVPAVVALSQRPDLHPAFPVAASAGQPLLHAQAPTATGEQAQGQGSVPAPRRWMRPAAWAAGGLALGFAGLAVSEGVAANAAYGHAQSLLGPGGVVVSSSELPRYRALTAEGAAAVRNTWISAGASVVFAAAAGYFGWGSAQSPANQASF